MDTNDESSYAFVIDVKHLFFIKMHQFDQGH